MRTVLLSCLLAACMTLAGCFSIGTLPDKGVSPNNGIYRGVRADIDCMRTAENDTSGMELLCGLDLPFSLAFDTLFLPYTLYDTLRGPTEEAK